MPLTEDFVVVQVRRSFRRKLKLFAAQQETPMYEILEHALRILEQECLAETRTPSAEISEVTP